MRKLFNMMWGNENPDISPDSYSKWVKEHREKVVQLKKQQEQEEYENIKERLSRLEEAVFGDMDDGR